MATTDHPGPDRSEASDQSDPGQTVGGAAQEARAAEPTPLVPPSPQLPPSPPAAQPAAAQPAAAEPAAAEPAAVRRGTGPWWAKLCVALGALLVLVSGGSVAAIRLVAYRVDHAVAKQQLLDDAARTGRDRPAYTTTGPLNFLLLGSDFRSRTPTDGQRSDTIIVVHIPRGLDRAYLVSIPRDLRVVIPPFPATGYAGGQTKINAAYQHGGGGVGGTQLLSTTLTQLLGVGFDGAAIINFDGFRRAVDVLGGVTIHVDHRVTAKHLAYDRNGRLISVYTDPEGRPFVPEGARLYVFEPGFRRMTGEIALEWARTRYGLPGGDYDRQRHQQEFLRAMLAEAMAQDIVTNPVRLDQFVRAVGSSLAVDTNGVALEDLAFALRNVRPGTLVGVQVPSHPQNIGGVSYILQEDAAQSLYQAIRADNLDAWALENPSWVHRM